MCNSIDKRVAVAEGHRSNLMEHALNLVDLGERLKPTTKVFIKPNLVRLPSESPYAKVKGAYEPTISPTGDVNHRESIEGLLKYLTNLGVRDITIGEASGGADTPVIYKALALCELTEEYNANIIDLNYAESMKVPVKDMVLDHLWVPKVILDSEFNINLAVLKTHGNTVVTLALKNWGMGIPPGRYYERNKAGTRWQGADGVLPIHTQVPVEHVMGQEVAVSKVITDVCLAKTPDFNIIDGYTVVDYQSVGSRSHRIRDANLVIAGYDMVAVDAVASRIIAIDPAKIIHIKYSEEISLGTMNPAKIKVLGTSIEEATIPATLWKDRRRPCSLRFCKTLFPSLLNSMQFLAIRKD